MSGSDSMKLTKLFSLLMVLSIVSVVAGVDFPGGTMLWNETQNAAHAPAFGLIAIGILFLLRHGSLRPGQAGVWCYGMALGITVGTGVAVEVFQSFVGRDAEVIDVVRDALGAVSCLAVFITYDPRIAGGGWIRRSRVVIRSFSVLVFLAAFVSLGICGMSYAWRNHAFPLVCDFGSRWSDQFIKLEDATLKPFPAPSGWLDQAGSRVGKLRLGQSEYPGVTIEEPYPDWRLYDTLCLDLYSDRADPLGLGLRIDDIHHNYESTDRWTGRIAVVPGPNHLRIALEQVQKGPVGRETDMAAIRRIILFAHQPQDTVIIYLGRIWLE